jgi:hypothetical protein
MNPIVSSSLGLTAIQENPGKPNLQTRIVTKGSPVSKSPFWEKISRVFHELIQWCMEMLARVMKSFDRKDQEIGKGIDKTLKKKGKEAETTIEKLFQKKDKEIGKAIDELPLDCSFLNGKDPAYNVQRLSELKTANAVQSVCTEEIFKSIPKTNPIRLGYADPVHYQTHLGDRAIALQAALTALGIFGMTRTAFFLCMADQTGSVAAAYKTCKNYEASLWHSTSGKTLLAASALLLGASLYAHRKGWLGAMLHDRSLGWRQRQIEALLRNAGKELQKQAIEKPEETAKTAARILRNAELIEITLHVELQLPLDKAKSIGNILKQACEQVVDPAPPPTLPAQPKPAPTVTGTAIPPTQDKTA